jgi:hypothetical protein
MELGNRTTTIDAWVLLDDTSSSFLKRKHTVVLGVYPKRELAEQDMTKTSRVQGPFKMVTTKYRPPTPIPKMLGKLILDDSIDNKVPPVGVDMMPSVPEVGPSQPPQIVTVPEVGILTNPNIIKVPAVQ